MNKKIVEEVKTAPKTPGVYVFYKNKTPLYIGKASSLKNRLQAYLKISDPKTQQLHNEANQLKIIKLSSSIEALIEEARLIKELKPQLNIYWRDDKNHFYVAFTKDDFPRIFIAHQIKNAVNDYLGPFTDGQALRLILKILRRHFPYCTCLIRQLVRQSLDNNGSFSASRFHFRNCINAQIGLCPGFCCMSHCYKRDRSYHSKYQKNIKTIKSILSGQKKNILKKIIRPEDNWAAENILEHSAYLDAHHNPHAQKIECYDVSNFAGKEAVGAFTVLTNQSGRWLPDRNQFRRFKIRDTKNTRDDHAMIAEILTRRLNHSEWPYPDLIIIDGGIAQYNAARKILISQNLNSKINLLSFAKPTRQIYGQSSALSANDYSAVEMAINQTHQYVIGYHRQLRGKIIL